MWPGSPVERALTLLRVAVLENPWIPDGTPGWADSRNHRKPTEPQALLYMCGKRHVLFGGSRGGAKSEGILVGGLMFADLPGHAGLIVRRHYTDLTKSNALINRSKKWLWGRGAKWNEQTHCWTFPSGYELFFGALDRPEDFEHHRGSEVQYLGTDESGQFDAEEMALLTSCLRKSPDNIVPIRDWRSANPDGPGEETLYHEFVEPWELGRQEPDHLFIPADVYSNPNVDPEYVAMLERLPPLLRQKHLEGKWMLKSEGKYFQAKKFREVPLADMPEDWDALLRCWDLAATEPSEDNKDPDWTRGGLLGIRDGKWSILDVEGCRKRHHDVKQLIKTTADKDGAEVLIVIPQDPGQAGKSQHSEYRDLLAGFEVRRYIPPSNKEVMARPVSASVDAGDVSVVKDAAWLRPFYNEICPFPARGIHDDQVDILSMAWVWGPWLVKRNAGARVRLGVKRVEEAAPRGGRPSMSRPTMHRT